MVAAVYASPDRIERAISARVFILAAGAVENARLLLLSASRAFPDGLANRSGLVGKMFMSHPLIDVTGRARDNMYPYRIGFSTAMSRHFAVSSDRATRGSFFLEFLNSAGPKPEELALASGLTGAALRRHVQEEFGHTLGVRIYCEQLPDPGNAVSLNHRVRDCFGQPVPHIAYGLAPYERAALDAGKQAATRILQMVGATEIRAGDVSAAAHQIGTHRMGGDPRTSVVDGDLRAHDVPNLYLVGSGCFVTASSSPPTLTIAALAIRAAEHIAASLRADGAPPSSRGSDGPARSGVTSDRQAGG